MSDKERVQVAVRVSTFGIFINIFLSIFKLVAGVVSNSAAMVSDAVHSLSDVLGGIIVIIGVKLASKAPDKEHQYGHERFECVVAIILAGILTVTGIYIGYGGLKTILAGDYENLSSPGLLALIAALVSIIVKESLFWVVTSYATKLRSTALKAEAWHHRSDAFSSVGSFIGILGARIGFPVLDSVACVIICFFIIKAGCSMFIDAINKMADKSCSDETVQEIRNIILEQGEIKGEIKIDLLKTRMFGDKIFVDVEISVDGNLTLYQSHEIAQIVHDAVETGNPNVKHCMVHVNPCNEEERETAKEV